MSLKENISNNLKEAMKNHESLNVGVLRMLLSGIHNKEIEKQGKGSNPELTEEEIIEVLRKEAKKRRESVEIYSKAGRTDLSENEAKELLIIEQFLPEGLNEQQVEAIVKKVIDSGVKDFGMVMKAATAEIAGKAEARLVSEIAKKLLG